MTKRIFSLASLFALACTLAFGQGGVNKTTLSQALDGKQTCFLIASATNIVPGMIGFAESEGMLIMSVNSTTVCAIRGYSGTAEVSHLTGTPFVAGTAIDWATLGNVPTASKTETSAVSAPVASATTITASGLFFHLTGTTAVATINLPPGFLGGCITVIPDGVGSTTNAGNIAIASTTVVSKALRLCYDYTLATPKWFPSY